MAEVTKPKRRREYYFKCTCGLEIKYDPSMPWQGATCTRCATPIKWQYRVITTKEPVSLTPTPTPPRMSPDQTLQNVVAWVSQQNNLDSNTHQELLELLNTERFKIDVFMMAVALKRIQRLGRMMEFSEAIENELFTQTRIQGADTGALIRLLQTVSGQVNDALAYLTVMKSKDQQGAVIDARKYLIDLHSLTLPVDGTPQVQIPKEKESRDTVRTVMSKLLEMVQGHASSSTKGAPRKTAQ